MLHIYPIPALDTNYFWLLHPQSQPATAYIVDPGAAEPVIRTLGERRLRLAAILVTHHHHDHVDGIDELVGAYGVPVYGPRSERIPQVTHPLADGDWLRLPGLETQILAIPGHTQEHIAYLHSNRASTLLFCGDTLFAAGCGKLLNGTAQQLFRSLSRLSTLPPDTSIYCGHEYTLVNLRFAQTVEPNNRDINQRLARVEALRRQGSITLPTSLAEELRTNPFLRCHLPQVKAAAESYSRRKLADAEAVFTVLRQWKDHF